MWRHANGKPSRRDKAANQQYLTPREEKTLLEYVLRMSERGYSLPVKFLRPLALVIARQRCSTFQVPTIDGDVRPPGKNWPQGFYKRHPQLKAKRVKALDWARHDHNIHDKVLQWFTLIGKELHDPAIVPENVYNMDETGVLLSVLSSLKVLVSKQDLRNCRGAGVKRTFSDSDRMYLGRREISQPINCLACLNTSQHLDDPPNPWMAFCVLENWIRRYGNQLVLDTACV